MYTQTLQSDLRAAPKQEFMERLEEELKEVKSQLQIRSEELRRYVHVHTWVLNE